MFEWTVQFFNSLLFKFCNCGLQLCRCYVHIYRDFNIFLLQNLPKHDFLTPPSYIF